MLPPIRYPLPSLVALILVAALAWRGEGWTRAWRAEVAAQARRALEGPPVPRSSRPQIVVGPIVRRGLLLRDSTPLADRPNGPTTGQIDRRMFVDIYDQWPDPRNPTHVRVGNRQPLGWISAPALLPWSTRLVVRPPSGRLIVDGGAVAVGSVACPVLNSRADAVQVATWTNDHPWEAVDRVGWVPLVDLPPEAWGVWISQVELPSLLRLAIGSQAEPGVVRLRAVLGRITGGEPFTPTDLSLARPALPSPVFAPATTRPGAVDRLAEANAQPRTDARWSGLSFRFLSLTDLP